MPRSVIINGASTADRTVEDSARADSNGEIDVTVESTAFAAFRIVVFLDDDDDDEASEQPDLNSDNEPTETFGLSGLITVLAPEAPAGS